MSASRVFYLLVALILSFLLLCCGGLSTDRADARNVPRWASTMWGARHCPDEINLGDRSPARIDNALEVDGFYDFCDRKPNAVICRGHTGTKLPLAIVTKLEKKLRAVFLYRSDFATFRVGDRWDNWTVCGDCEDYALTLSEMLAREGEGGEYMGLEMMMLPQGGHATLTVDTSDHGTVEISVGENGPFPFRPLDQGWRMARIVMDGKRLMRPYQGFQIVAKKN